MSRSAQKNRQAKITRKNRKAKATRRLRNAARNAETKAEKLARAGRSVKIPHQHVTDPAPQPEAEVADAEPEHAVDG